MMISNQYEVGEISEFGTYHVTLEEVVEFATRFDPQDMHLDNDVASRNPVFRKISASGVHTLAMTSRMFVDHARATGKGAVTGLGIDALKMVEPVYPGDTLSVRVLVADLRRSESRPDCGIVSLNIETINQNGHVVLRHNSALLIELE